MKCVNCDNIANCGARACNECLEKSKLECIEAITIAMEKLMKVHNNEIAMGIMTQENYKSNMDAYHNQRIERDILLGKYPKKMAPKARFRNGLYM